MANGRSLQRKIGGLIRKFQVVDRVVQLRTISQTGGNQLLGLGGTVQTTDVVLDPQPIVNYADAEMVAQSNGLYRIGDYELTLSGTVTEEQLKSSVILYGEEQLKIVSLDRAIMTGVVVVWKLVARTVTP